MSETIIVSILRNNPENDQPPSWCRYEIPFEEKNTVLGTLLYIQEELDPTLAFRYGCRYKRCGLCAVEVDGKPRMACHTYVKDGMRLSPLSKLPVIRDLVIDRESFFLDLQKRFLFVDEENCNSGIVLEPEEGAKLRSCAECLSCFASCPQYIFGDKDFGGPYIFVKLAQLSLDPRDNRNRHKQAIELGINRCLDCDSKCYCPNGLNIYREAVNHLLSKSS
ncbi:MAG: 2Fe-2S iron-sulfur cluster-binding protein [Bacillota bacterium]|nr:2Fe-2S iron-sulfur cluster-binding protein [Bacillota bacterium]